MAEDELGWSGVVVDRPGLEAERNAACDVRDVAIALQHCHGLDVVHRCARRLVCVLAAMLRAESAESACRCHLPYS